MSEFIKRAPAFHAGNLARPALQSAITLFLAVMISMMATVKPAQAEGTVASALNRYYVSASGYGGYLNAASPEAACGPKSLVTGPVITTVSSTRWLCTYTYISSGALFYVDVFYISPVCPAHSTGTTVCTCNANYVPDASGTSCVPPNSCPANMSGTPCACNPPYILVNGSCEAERYNITLSGGATTKPWHKKHDADHADANLAFTATVKNQNGAVKPGIDVSISSEATPGSGGHAHDNSRPKGWLAKTTTEIANQIQSGATHGSGALNGKTDGSGTLVFVFGAEEASGEHTLTATCAECTNTATDNIAVGIPGLMRLDADPLGYELRGSTDGHPDNHYFSPAAMVQIINLAHVYRKKFGQLLRINDSSLRKGGTFDVKLDWTSASKVHGGHRVGVVVDVNNSKKEPNQFFKELATRLEIKADWHSKGTAPHYHLLLIGRDN